MTNNMAPLSQGAVCTICEAVTQRSVRADYAPFLIKRCGLAPTTQVRANFCDQCEHVFFTPLLDDAALKLLYTDYRGSQYLRDRQKTEPSYDPEHVYFEQDEARIRTDFYSYFLSELRTATGLVVDFGGADGTAGSWAFPHAERVVVEHDYAERGIDLATIANRADVLLCAHVFEHVPDPLPVLAKLVQGMRPGAYVYVELPKEYEGSLAEAFSALEGKELAGEPFVPTALQRMHEHIAHFSKRSAQWLMRRAGATPLEVHLSDHGIFGVLGVVGDGPPRAISRGGTAVRSLHVARSSSVYRPGMPGFEQGLVYGWRRPEQDFVWSSGRRAQLRISMPDDAQRGGILRMTLQPLISPAKVDCQHVEVTAIGMQPASWTLANRTTIALPLEAGLLHHGAATIDLSFPDATTPKILGLSSDESLLAVQLIDLQVEPLNWIGNGEWVHFSSHLPESSALLSGWRPPEQGFVWSNSTFAKIVIGFAFDTENGVDVHLDFTPLIAGGVKTQRLAFSSEGQALSEFTADSRTIAICHIPANAIRHGLGKVDIHIPDATSLRNLGIAPDDSILGIQLHALCAEPASPQHESFLTQS